MIMKIINTNSCLGAVIPEISEKHISKELDLIGVFLGGHFFET